MFRWTRIPAFTLMASLVTPAPTLGQPTTVPATGPGDRAPILTTNRTMLASLQRIARGSALWREALGALRGTGRHVLVLTPDEVVVADARGHRADHFDPTVLAEAAPIADHDDRVQVVLVVVNLTLMEEVHRRQQWPPSELHDDLDRVLIHEIYGHAFPYLLAGTLSGQCADPKNNERASDACAIRRENAVRAELGLGQRRDYGLGGLALARRWR